MRGSILLFYLLLLSVLFLVGVVQADHLSCHQVTTTGNIETIKYSGCGDDLLREVHAIDPTLFDNNCPINRNCDETDITKLNPRNHDLMHFDSATGDKICEVLGYDQRVDPLWNTCSGACCWDNEPFSTYSWDNSKSKFLRYNWILHSSWGDKGPRHGKRSGYCGHTSDPGGNWIGINSITCEKDLSCGDGICNANECKTAVSGKIECPQDCQYQCSDGCDNDDDNLIDYDGVVDSGNLDFHSVHAPPYYDKIIDGKNLRFDDPDYSTWDVEDKCMLPITGSSVKASNGIFPREISNNDKYSPGDILKISNPSGNICLRVWKANNLVGGAGPKGSRTSSCKDCCGRYFDNYCGDSGKAGKDASNYWARDYTNSNIKIGFYSSNIMSATNSPIEEFEFNSFVGNDIEIPAGTKYIYVYYIDPSDTGVHAYGDNNAAFKISFDYRVKSLDNRDPQCTSDTDDSEAPECSNGVDDDNDGKIDFLVEGSDIPDEKSYEKGRGGDALNDIIQDIIKDVPDFSQPYEFSNTKTCHIDPAFNPGINNNPTSKRICNFLGYANYDSMYEHYYASCNDNCVASYDGNKWEIIDGCIPRRMNKQLRCFDPIPNACNDGIDNDGDTLVDYCDGSNADCDPGCASANDKDERLHDPQCDSDTDDDEGTSQCNDDEDNDGDGKKDYCKDDDSNLGTCDPDCDSLDDSEVPECSDNEDNDGDGKKDYCKDDDSNAGTCDLNCQSLDDDNEACEPDQIIMKLVTEGDSLGALWNDADYDVNICYEAIFGEEYVGDNPHVCDGDNKVLGLKETTDAFGETADSDSDSYSVDVCYGDLRCRSIDTGDSNAGSCDETGEEIVASLSVATDAKISKGDDTDFPIKICCKLEVIQLERAYWAYMNDEMIESEDSEGNDVIIGLKDRVKLVAEGKEFKDETITYTIYEKCDGIWDCLDDFFTGNDVAAQTTLKGEFIWDAGKKLDDDTFSEGKYYFIAEIGELEVDSRENSDENSDELDNLDGILTVGPEDNDPPVAKIKFPLDKQMYFIDSPITFEQESFDLDDEFSYSWNLGDGTIKEGNSENLENYKFDYAYETEANLRQQDIVLTVTDGELSDTARVSILIINSTKKAYILAYTDLPKYGEEYGQVVDYDARSTYAVSSETVFDSDGKCSKVINCLAGNCPSETKGVPTSESLGCDYNGGTGGVPVIPTSGGVNYETIEFCWVLDDNIAEKICGFGIAGAVFNHKYPSSGLHESSLEASIEYTITS